MISDPIGVVFFSFTLPRTLKFHKQVERSSLSRWVLEPRAAFLTCWLCFSSIFLNLEGVVSTYSPEVCRKVLPVIPKYSWIWSTKGYDLWYQMSFQISNVHFKELIFGSQINFKVFSFTKTYVLKIFHWLQCIAAYMLYFQSFRRHTLSGINILCIL